MVFVSLLLCFCLYFFHRSFTAHWDACWFTSTRLINDHYEPAFLTFILRALLCHSTSPPRRSTTQKSRVTLGYKTIHWARGSFEKGRSARLRYLELSLQNFLGSEVDCIGFLDLWRLVLECASLSFCRCVSFLILFSLFIASVLELNSST